jgi:hypothetical protein
LRQTLSGNFSLSSKHCKPEKIPRVGSIANFNELISVYNLRGPVPKIRTKLAGSSFYFPALSGQYEFSVLKIF